MPRPKAICLEDRFCQQDDARYLQCVADVGGSRRLGLRRADGAVVGESPEPLACELWVSADDRLMLLRPVGAPPVSLRRAGRVLQLPCGKPVVLLDQDEVETAGRHYRLHLHGAAASWHQPQPLRPAAGRIAALAAAAALIAGCGKQPIEVLDHPPKISTPEEPIADGGKPTDGGAPPSDGGSGLEPAPEGGEPAGGRPGDGAAALEGDVVLKPVSEPPGRPKPQ